MSIQEINRIKNHYPAGTRIELISMNDPFAPVPSGMKGSVDYVDDAGQITIAFTLELKKTIMV